MAPRLTLTLGLRYDYFQRYKQKDDKFVDIYLNGFVIQGTAVTTQNSPYGRELLAPDRNNFGPRFGFAYRVTSSPRRLSARHASAEMRYTCSPCRMPLPSGRPFVELWQLHVEHRCLQRVEPAVESDEMMIVPRLLAVIAQDL